MQFQLTEKGKRRIRRWARGVLWTTGSLLVLFLGAWAVLAWYINSHKKELLARITTDLSSNMGGQLMIADMKPSIWGDFPFCSVVLRSVNLRDSLWDRHHHDLFAAEEVFVRMNPLRLITNRVDIRKLTIRKGSIYLFTDSSGYSNKYLLAKKDTTKASSPSAQVDFRLVALKEVDITLEDAPKLKSFSFHINSIEARSKRDGGDWQTDLNAAVLVRRMFFNKTRGSFLTNARLNGKIALNYDSKKKDLGVDAPRLQIDGQEVKLSGHFSLAPTPPAFSLHLETRNVRYKKAIGWVSENISSKLKPFDFEKPVSLIADLNGNIKYRDTPLVNVRWTIENNTLIAPVAQLKKVSFTGSFNNEVVRGGGHADANSRIQFENFKAEFEGIPISADTVAVTNLIRPALYAHIRSDFPLKKLNELGDLPMTFTKGEAAMDVRYTGGLLPQDTIYPNMNGYIRIKDGDLSYDPRGISFTGVQANIEMSEDNLYLKNISAQTPGGPVSMEGSAMHFFRFYFAQPGLVSVYWKASSPSFDLTPFQSVAGGRRKRSTSSRTGGNTALQRPFAQLSNVLEQCTANLELSFGKLKFQQMAATNFTAKAALSPAGIQIQQLSLGQSGGTISLTGNLAQNGSSNNFNLNANIQNVAVDQFFLSMDNFGQNAIVASNLNGRFSATATVQGRLNEAGKLVERSVAGRAKFRLTNGALRNFGPFQSISRFAFKKRNLDNVQFDDLGTELVFEGGKYTIYPLTIRSTAFNAQVQGLYAPGGGTDIAIVLPLGNPANESEEQKKKKTVARGITLFLRAQDGKDGKVAIGWDPRKKGLKHTGELFD